MEATAGDNFSDGDIFLVLQPVYEKNETAILGKQLVLTPWMLLDRLKECEELASALQQSVAVSKGGQVRVECPHRVAAHIETLQEELQHLLLLLWRGGLWMESDVEIRAAVDGHQYNVAREPFTDGKCFGKPLPTVIPDWKRELLGIDTF